MSFSGNRVNYENNPVRGPTRVYLICYKGNYVDCFKCPEGSLFHEDKSAYGRCIRSSSQTWSNGFTGGSKHCSSFFLNWILI